VTVHVAMVALKKGRKSHGSKVKDKAAGNAESSGAKGGHDPTSVFFRGLPDGTADRELRTWVEKQIGPTTTCFVIRGDYGLVRFKKAADAERCLEELQGAEYNGAVLKLQAAKKKLAPKKGDKREAGDGKPETKDGFDLRTVVLRGFPKGTEATDAQNWVETRLPGGSGVEAVKVLFNTASSSSSATDRPKTGDGTAFLISFKKDPNARRALDELQGGVFDGHTLSASFRALDTQQRSAKAGRLIIRNLAFSATQKIIKKAFEKIGPVVEMHLPPKAGQKDGSTSDSHRGFGFVQFSEFANAERAIAELNGSKICGRGIAVDWAVDARVYGNLKEQEVKTQEKSSGKDGAKSSKDDIGASKKRSKKELEEEDAEDEDEEEEEEDDEKDESEAEDEGAKNKKEVEKAKKFLEESDDEEEDEPKAKADTADKKTDLPLRKVGFDVEEGRTLFVRNVPFDAGQADVRELFRKFGAVYSVRLVSDKTGLHEHNGVAFIQYRDKDGADAALATEAEAERKLKELSSITKKSDQRELPAVEGFGIALKGRRLVVARAVKPGEASKIVEERKPEKGSGEKEKRKWMHLLNIGRVDKESAGWEKLSKSEQRQRQASVKERKWRVNNPNFTIHPMRLSIRNLPTTVDTTSLTQTIIEHLGKVEGVAPEDAGRKKRGRAAQKLIEKVSLVRDTERRDVEGQRRSKGYGFATFKDHTSALSVLELLNDNPNIFHGGRRPIIEFAIEDKRKLQMQKELFEKHGHKLSSSGANEADGKGEGKGKKEKAKKEMSRGQRQREKRRGQKADAELKVQNKKVADAKSKAKQKVQQEEEAVEASFKKKKKVHQPDAGLPSKKRANTRKSWEMADDYELKAMDRLRGVRR